MVENEKSKEEVKVQKTTQDSVNSSGKDESLEITDADEKAGAELMEKLLNAMKETANPDVEVVNKEAEFQEKLARQQAEFDNFRKRMEKEKQEILVNANANLISEILPVLDHFELSLEHNKDKGVKMIYDELNEVLKKQGLKIIDSTGAFNPKIHEAVMTAEGNKDGIILEEFQKGFLLNEKLLRASKVKVSSIGDKK